MRIQGDGEVCGGGYFLDQDFSAIPINTSISGVTTFQKNGCRCGSSVRQGWCFAARREDGRVLDER